VNDPVDQITARAQENFNRIMEDNKIKAMGETCRDLFDAGASLNMGEALLFLNSLRTGDEEQCNRLIETLKQRAKQ
jgi:hypothetical protein